MSSKKDAKALAAERAKLFRDQTSFIPTKRIPHFASAVTWKIFDAGHTIDEAITDHKVMESCVRHFLDTYFVDGLIDTGIRNQFEVMKAFGSDGYYYYTPEVVGVHDHHYCKVDELMEYLEDPIKYAWTKILPEKYGDEWANKSLDTWKKTFKEYVSYTMFVIHMAGVSGSYGIPVTAPNNPSKGAIDFGMEVLMANLLGMKDLSLALRRSSDKIEEFVREFDKQHIDPVVEKALASEGPNAKYCWDASTMMLVHNVLSPQQFERFYLPSLKKLYEAYESKDMHVRVFTEGKILGFKDYFKDYKKGTLTFHVEQDDPLEFRKELPNVAFMGGLTTVMLSESTPQQCVEETKRLCAEMGNGGFILSENKMMSYRNDCSSDNYLAVCNYMKDQQF